MARVRRRWRWREKAWSCVLYIKGKKSKEFPRLDLPACKISALACEMMIVLSRLI